MRLAIVGSRDFPRLSAVRRFVLALPEDTEVISGHGRGVDQMAEHTARFERQLKVTSFRPQSARSHQPSFNIVRWDYQGSGPPVGIQLLETGYPSFGAAAFARNRLIVASADVVAAFWDGESKGTKHSIDLAEEYGIRVELYGKDSVT